MIGKWAIDCDLRMLPPSNRKEKRTNFRFTAEATRIPTDFSISGTTHTMKKETEEQIAGVIALLLVLSLFAFRFFPEFLEKYVAPAWPLILIAFAALFVSVAALAFRRAVIEFGLNATFTKIGIAAATLIVVASITMFWGGYWGNSKPSTPRGNSKPSTPPKKTIRSPTSNQFVDQCAKLDASLEIGVTTTEFRQMLIELAALQRKSNDMSRAKQVVSDYEGVLFFLGLSQKNKLRSGECILELNSQGELPAYLFRLDALGGDWMKEVREIKGELLRIVRTRQYLVTRKERGEDFDDKPVIRYYISKDAAYLIAEEAKKIWEQM